MTAPRPPIVRASKKFLPCGRHPPMHRCEEIILKQFDALLIG